MFKPYSKYPPCYKDLSFWLPQQGLHENDFCDMVRDTAGDLVEDVKLVSKQFPVTLWLTSNGHSKRARSTTSRTPKLNAAVNATESTTGPWIGPCRMRRRTKYMQ
jgi:hypothetical protein